jgi:Alginate export
MRPRFAWSDLHRAYSTTFPIMHRHSGGTGITAPNPLWTHANLAVFYLGLDRKNSTFEKGAGRTIRHTIGAHSWKTAGRWDFDYEGIVQWGSFRDAPIRAWALSESTGYTLNRSRFRPRLGIRSDIASGDGGAKERALSSFDPLFPAAPVYSGPSWTAGTQESDRYQPVRAIGIEKNSVPDPGIVIVLARKPA